MKLLLAACVALIGLVGCRDSAFDVPIHPIKGSVVNGRGEPFTGGAIEFRRTDGKQMDAIGEIQQDGTFSVATMSKNDRKAGLAEGEYRVVVSTSTEHPQVNRIFHLEHIVSISNSATELAIVADNPRRYEFRSQFTLKQMLAVLKSIDPGIHWQNSALGGREIIAGRFPPHDGQMRGDGMRILHLQGKTFVAEDWASVFRDRNPWPKKQSTARVLKALRATDITELER